MTKSVNIWEDLLPYIGVKIMLTKYDYYIFEREFDSIEKLQLINIKSPIYFNNISGINVASTQLQPPQAITYIGVTSQPNGYQNERTK